MRKVCRDRFGAAASGTCPTCEKYTQVNLGKHVALYHLDLAQLWHSHLDKLYDLPENIQDGMGLQALRPSAAVCKVMTIPNSNCVRIVTPDEHVSTGFHEILVYDMESGGMATGAFE